MTLNGWAATDVGRKRKRNEDSYLVDEELGLYIVADGMGGSAGGELASSRCVDIVRASIEQERAVLDSWEQDPTRDAADRVQVLVDWAIKNASAELFQIAATDAELGGMGTTVVVLIARGRKGVIAHVGDSRAYVLRNGRSHQLTEDHSLVEEQVKRGLLTREEAQRSNVRNVITRAVGPQESIEVDTLVVDILPGDVFVLCSDGVHGYLVDGDLERMVGSPSESAAERLIEFANDQGGRDNSTAVVIAERSGADAKTAANTNQEVEILRQIPLFQYMTYKELLAILSLAETRSFAAGQPIITEGQTGDEMFVVVRGQVEVLRANVQFARLPTGGHFGEMALVDNAPRSATVRALAETNVLALGRDALLRLMRKDSLMAVKLLWAFSLVLSERLRKTNETVVVLKDELEKVRARMVDGSPFGLD